MPTTGSNPQYAVSELLRELEALRARLDQAPEWFSRPEHTMVAAALAEQVKHSCQEAAQSGDEAEVAALLAKASRRLAELQVLLGAH